jgi:hypothetical protein
MEGTQEERWKKFHRFHIAAVYAWQPKTYFGRAQLITVFDALDQDSSREQMQRNWQGMRQFLGVNRL